MTVNTYTGTDNLEVMEEAVNYNRFLMSLVLDANSKRRSMLDFGAGVGTFAKAFAESGFSVDCVELDQSQAAGIRKSALTVYESIKEVPSDHYEFAYSFNVLEHIVDDRQALADLYRVLRPNGRLLIYVPACPILFSSMDTKVGHVRRYRRAELLEKVSTSGFSVDYVRFVDSLGFFASLAFKHFGGESGRIDKRTVRFYDRWIFPISAILDKSAKSIWGKNLALLAEKPPPRNAR